MIFRLKIKLYNGSVHPEWQFKAAPVPTEVFEDESFWCVRIGKVYSSPEKPLREWITSFSANPSLAAELDGRYIFIQCEKKSGAVKIWTDRYRALGAFVIFNQDSIVVSNWQLLTTEEFDHGQVDSRALADLLLYGYVLPPLTLYKNAQMLSGFTEIQGTSIQQQDWRKYWPKAEIKRDWNLRDMAESLRFALNSLISEWQVRVFRCSGGVDSRVLANFMSKENRRRVEFEVVCSPYLQPEEDQDVIGARMMTEALGVPLKIMKFPANISSYFLGFEEMGFFLSGLYGGDLLGGYFLLQEPPSVARNPEEALELPEAFEISPYLREDSRERFRQVVAQSDGRNALFSNYLGSFRTTLYKSSKYGWSHAHWLNAVAPSPFGEKCVLDKILNVPSEELNDYAFYGRFVRETLDDQMKGIPFLSRILEGAPELPRFTTGQDPKFRHEASEGTRPLPDRKLEAFLESHGIRAKASTWYVHPFYALRMTSLKNHFENYL